MTLRCTCLGHASVLVETPGTRVLMDPILDEFVSGGGNRIDPPRYLVKQEVTRDLSAIIISHRHDDHFSPVDLLELESLASVPIFIPTHAGLAEALRGLGTRDVRQLRPWETAMIGDLQITATPSKVSFPEMGIAFRWGGCFLLNLVDTAYWSFANEIREALGPPSLALVPFQAGGYAEFYPLRIGGPPPGLLREMRSWSDFALADHLDAITTMAPKCVASFADGFRYTDDCINAWHFPKSTDEFISKLSERYIRACEAVPGTRFTIDSSD